MSSHRGPGIPPPKGIGKAGADPVVRKYTEDLAARARSAGAKDKVPIPDLGMAAAQYRPGKDGPMTLSQIAVAQENIGNMSNNTKPQLRPETVQGLSALSAAVAKENAPAAAAPSEPQAPPKKFIVSDDNKKAASELSDLDLDLMMARIRNDVINNEEERKFVEKDLVPMDLADGLMTGVFTQKVPVIAGKMEVVFRSLTPFENEEMRRAILDDVLKDERFANMAGERLAMWQTVASVHIFNGNEMPSHLRDVAGGKEFLWEVFRLKVARYENYPSPLIHALTTHAYWFDLRVRRLFSNTALKNG